MSSPLNRFAATTGQVRAGCQVRTSSLFTATLRMALSRAFSFVVRTESGSKSPAAARLAPIPAGLSFEQAAAVPLTGLTAHQGLEILGLRGGEYLFVTGGAGGVGHMVVQLAVERGARVVATASPENHDFLRELGAEPLDYHDPDLLARWREFTGGAGADAAFDLWGGEAQEQAFSVMRKGGRLISLASPPEPRDCFETRYMFVRPSGYDLGEHLTPLLKEGHLRPHLQATYPLAAAAEAMEVLEGGHVRGKLVLTID